MSAIPTNLTEELVEEGFQRHVRPRLRAARRDCEGKVPLFKIFSYILDILYG